MKHEPAIFEDPDEAVQRASIDRSMADFAAGRYHSHTIVSAWLKTWSEPGSKPFHEWLADRNA